MYSLDEVRAVDPEIAQAIVEEHRGAIWAESDGEGKNSFFVRLPV